MGSLIMRKDVMKIFGIRNRGVIRNVDSSLWEDGTEATGVTCNRPEQDAFCSEALDENASILRKVLNILFGRTKEKKSVHYKQV
jgi:hypothetical protein